MLFSNQKIVVLSFLLSGVETFSEYSTGPRFCQDADPGPMDFAALSCRGTEAARKGRITSRGVSAP